MSQTQTIGPSAWDLHFAMALHGLMQRINARVEQQSMCCPIESIRTFDEAIEIAGRMADKAMVERNKRMPSEG